MVEIILAILLGVTFVSTLVFILFYEKEQIKRFDGYFKHIKDLEKLALPSPITTKMVRDVMDRDPFGIPPLENDIDKAEDEGEEINESNFDKVIQAPNIKIEGDMEGLGDFEKEELE